MSLRSVFASNLKRLMDARSTLSSPVLLEKATMDAGAKVGKSTIDRTLRCETPINLDYVESLAGVLGVRPWQLLQSPEESSAPVTEDPLRSAVQHLADLLIRVDDLDRGMVAPLLSHLATHPGEVDVIAAKLSKVF